MHYYAHNSYLPARKEIKFLYRFMKQLVQGPNMRKLRREEGPETQRTMATTLLGNSNLFLSDPPSADPVQIISKPGLQQEVPPISQIKPEFRSKPTHKWHIVWRNVLIFVYLHIAAFYGIYYFFTISQWRTRLWAYGLACFSSLGVTMGAHRLWAHRSYKAKFPLRLILAIGQSCALQNDIYEWVRDHRVHHKFTDTDADPHDSSRGFFFSHMGWLMVKKHKNVFIKGKTIDMSDVEADPIVRFQRKYYLILAPLFCFIIPSVIPWYFWNEVFSVSYHIAMFRYMITLHGTWLVNSAAHMWGSRPFDKFINAADNRFVAFIGFGEGWHNYHHVFPWDYKAAELGNYRMNFSTCVLDFMARIGWAYDLKTVAKDMVMKRAKRTGDGSREYGVDLSHIPSLIDHHHEEEENVWGWDDKDLTQDDRRMAEIHNPKTEKIN